MHSTLRRRATRTVTLVVVAMVMVAPAAAHNSNNLKHNYSRHYRELIEGDFYLKRQTYSRRQTFSRAQTNTLFTRSAVLASDTGTINDPANPVDWSQLKSVPVGFADGVDDGGTEGPATDVDCDACIETADIAASAVTSANLAFDPATQAELDGHGHDHGDLSGLADDDHPQYALTTDLATGDGNAPNSGANRVSWQNLTDVPSSLADGVDDVGSGQLHARPPYSGSIVDPQGEFGSMTIGSDGLPIIVYWGPDGVNVMHCGDPGCTDGNSVSAIETLFRGAGSPSIIIGADGSPLLSYASDGLRVVRCGDARCGSGNTISMVDDSSSGETSIAVGPDGLPMVSYYHGGEDALRFVHCGDAACGSGNTVSTVAELVGLSVGTSLTVGVDGSPVLSYVSTQVPLPTRSLVVLHCGDASCGSGSTTTIEAGTDAVNSSITVGADGIPLISYEAEGQLKVVHCGDLRCSAGNLVRTIDDEGTARWSALSIGADDLPVIAYRDEDTDGLKVAHCGDRSCGLDNVVVAVEAGGTGFFPSVAIGTDGYPVIVHTSGPALRVTHCSSRFCVPYQRLR